MRRHFNLIASLFFCVGALFISSCSNEDDGPVGIAGPIKSVTAENGSKTATATISDADKTIRFKPFELLTPAEAKVTFTLADGVKMKTPATTTATINLTSNYKVIVNDGANDVTYTLFMPILVTSAKVGTENAVINKNIITVKYTDGLDITAVVLDLKLADGATVKSPTNKTFDLDNQDQEMIVSYEGVDYPYTVKLDNYTDPMVVKGWTRVSKAKFGALPNYIKVYETGKLNKVVGDSAYVAIVDPTKATFSTINGGTPAALTLDAAIAANAGWNLYYCGVNSTTVQLYSYDNGFVGGDGKAHMTLGIDAAGNASMKYAGLFEGALYSYDSYIPIAAKGKEWDVDVAFSGILCVLKGGVVRTTDEVGTGWYDGNARSARTCIGVTEDNKILFFVCQNATFGCVGVSMLDLGNVIKSLGAVDAMALEGSSTADMRVNNQYTVKSKNIFNTTTGAKLADQSGARKYQSVLVVK